MVNLQLSAQTELENSMHKMFEIIFGLVTIRNYVINDTNN